ncbi:MAG: hypothetical protein Q9175_004618 [Cornicularia normoerica]
MAIKLYIRNSNNATPSDETIGVIINSLRGQVNGVSPSPVTHTLITPGLTVPGSGAHLQCPFDAAIAQTGESSVVVSAGLLCPTVLAAGSEQGVVCLDEAERRFGATIWVLDD